MPIYRISPDFNALAQSALSIQGAWIAGSAYTLAPTYARFGARGQLLCGAGLGVLSTVLISSNALADSPVIPISQVALVLGALGFILLNMGWLTCLKDRAELELIRRMNFDPSTRTLNRTGLNHQTSKLISRARKTKKLIWVLLIDLDHFKAVNDRWGHAAGDNVLEGVGGALRGVVGGNGLCARFGGEEFVVLIVAPNLSETMIVCEKIRNSVAEVVTPNGSPTRFSGGLVMLHGLSVSDADLAAADAAMYVAKHKGRNRIEAVGVCAHRVAA